MLKVIKTLVTTIMLKLSNASIIYCNTTLIVSFASLEFQFENVNRKIQKYSICSCLCGYEYDRVAIFRGLVHGLYPPIATVICVRWRNTWPAASNHIDNKNDWKPKENKPEDGKKGKEKRWTKSLLHETTFSIVSCVYDLVCLHLVWYGLKLCLFKLNVLG